MAPTENGIALSNGDSGLPSWLDNVTFEKAARACVGNNFAKIKAVNFENDNKTGENYSSLLLRVSIDVVLKDGTDKTVELLLKTPPTNVLMANIVHKLKLFPKEEQMYHNIIPKFEELYKAKGKCVKFAPTAYTVDRDVGKDYVLLEDLRTRKYKNANRIAGLDMVHMQQVLQKLAEFHAASACYVEHFGMFGEQYTVGVFSESNRELLKEFNASGAFLCQLKKWKNCQQIYEKLADSDNYLVERLLEAQKYSAREFNVLNHGDCWVNNILFQYDAFGNIKNTVFIDFQVGKYGTPAIDLYYLILSSAAMDIKLTQFDYMVRYYYDNLVENLKLLEYHRPLPKLRNLHTTLLKNGLAAYMVVSKVLPVVMLEKTDGANLENYMQDESKLKLAMFTNHKYVQAMTEILPWLNNRGLLDWK